MRGVVCPSLTWDSCSAVCYAPGMGGVKLRGREKRAEERKVEEGKKEETGWGEEG